MQCKEKDKFGSVYNENAKMDTNHWLRQIRQNISSFCSFGHLFFRFKKHSIWTILEQAKTVSRTFFVNLQNNTQQDSSYAVSLNRRIAHLYTVYGTDIFDIPTWVDPDSGEQSQNVAHRSGCELV